MIFRQLSRKRGRVEQRRSIRPAFVAARAGMVVPSSAAAGDAVDKWCLSFDVVRSSPIPWCLTSHIFVRILRELMRLVNVGASVLIWNPARASSKRDRLTFLDLLCACAQHPVPAGNHIGVSI
jgi:hypothetical protein